MAHTKIHNHAPQEKAKNIQPNNLQHTLHLAITKILIELFIITHSYPRLHAPLNSRNIAHLQPGQNIWLHVAYKILHMERYWPSIPHRLQHDVEAIHWARMAAKEDMNTITILMINHNNWTSQ